MVYGASDIFVLPSENEPWGLIVNEVMCAAIPVIVSDEVGCSADLVKNGIKGFQVKAGDVEAFAAAVEKLLVDPGMRKRMGAASLRIINGWSYEQCLQDVKKGLQEISKD